MPLFNPVNDQAQVAPRSRKCGLFGHSQIATCHWPYDTVGTPATIPTALMPLTTRDDKPWKSFAFCLEIQLKGRIDFPRSGNYGISGETSTEMAARANDAAAAMRLQNIAVVLCICFTNDRTRGVSLAQSKINAELIERAFLGQGITVVWGTDTPRGGADAAGLANRLAGTFLADHLDMKDFILARDNNKDVRAVNLWPLLALDDSSTGDMKDNKSPDWLHQDGRGAWDMATQFFPVFDDLFTEYFDGPFSNADVYAASNPRGASNNNPMLGVGLATGVKASGVTGAGLQPDGYVQGPTLPTGLTLAVTQGTDAEGRDYTQYVFGGTPTTAFPNFDFLRQDVTIGTKGLAVGGTCRALAEIEVLAGATGVWDFDFYTQANTLVARAGSESNNATASKIPAAGFKSPVRSGISTIPASTALVRLGGRGYFEQNAAVSATIRVYRVALMPNPTGDLA